LDGQHGVFYQNASNLVTGTLSDTRLSPNVALLNGNQSYIGVNTFNHAANSFTGSGTGLTSLNASALASGTVPADRIGDNSIAASKLASDADSLSKVSGGVLSSSGGNVTATGTISSSQASEMQMSSLHARAVDAGLSVAPLADHYGALVVSAAGAGTYHLVVPLDVPLKLYGRKPSSWSVTTHYSHASAANYITRTRVFCSHVAEVGNYVEDTTDRTSASHSSFAVSGLGTFAEEWRGKAIEYQVTLAAGGSLRIGGIILNYTY
jgi:hypothetical protein